MESLIGLVGVSGLLVMLGAAVVAYRWSRTRKYGRGLDSGHASDWSGSRDGRDTQAGRI